MCHSLHALHVHGRVLLPELRHLTALTELCLDLAVLTPKGEKLPHLPALQVLSDVGSMYGPSDLDDAQTQLRQKLCPDPQDLGLTYATPLLAEVRVAVGHEGTSSPHEQLVTLASLAQLLTIVLDFWYVHKPSDGDEDPEEDLLRPNTCSLPSCCNKERSGGHFSSLVLKDQAV